MSKIQTDFQRESDRFALHLRVFRYRRPEDRILLTCSNHSPDPFAFGKIVRFNVTADRSYNQYGIPPK